MSATFGRNIRMTIFGESHGKAIGLVLDGLPPGTPIDESFIKEEMARRAPGQNQMSTQRQEKDAFLIESGVFESKAAGTPICVLISNSDQHSKDYSLLKDVMRPGHADYAGKVKYKGFNDYRGGGHFSGRLTAPLVFAGALAKTMLAKRDITVGAHIARIGQVTDSLFDPLGETVERLQELRSHTLPVLDAAKRPLMEAEIMAAREQQDSVGGIIEVMAIGMPAGIGDPFFDSLESRLSHALFSVPAVKGIEFGAGFAMAALKGSEANDPMAYDGDRIKTTRNNNGGITGGITNGMPVLFRVAVKPTPSIRQPQKTVNVTTGEDTVLEIKGRHDPCIVPRAVPVIEAVTAWTLLDMLPDLY
ncbi:MAG: chorismate synthase [Acidaminococcaceae bacterium]|nr:chorismate synthase [Acidaminococcaceae bacterium]